MSIIRSTVVKLFRLMLCKYVVKFRLNFLLTHLVLCEIMWLDAVTGTAKQEPEDTKLYCWK